MKDYLKYLLIILAFFLGQFLGTQDKSGEELLTRKFEQEQKRDRESISALLEKLALKDQESEAIDAARVRDSIFFAGALERNKTAYNRLKRKYNEINLGRATHSQLDSVVSGLYPD